MTRDSLLQPRDPLPATLLDEKEKQAALDALLVRIAARKEQANKEKCPFANPQHHLVIELMTNEDSKVASLPLPQSPPPASPQPHAPSRLHNQELIEIYDFFAIWLTNAEHVRKLQALAPGQALRFPWQSTSELAPLAQRNVAIIADYRQHPTSRKWEWTYRLVVEPTELELKLTPPPSAAPDTETAEIKSISDAKDQPLAAAPETVTAETKQIIDAKAQYDYQHNSAVVIGSGTDKVVTAAYRIDSEQPEKLIAARPNKIHTKYQKITCKTVAQLASSRIHIEKDAKFSREAALAGVPVLMPAVAASSGSPTEAPQDITFYADFAACEIKRKTKATEQITSTTTISTVAHLFKKIADEQIENLATGDFLFIAYQLIESVMLLHQSSQLLHRDLKPLNFLLMPGLIINMGDLADAREINTRQPDSIAGTPDYMSPQLTIQHWRKNRPDTPLIEGDEKIYAREILRRQFPGLSECKNYQEAQDKGLVDQIFNNKGKKDAADSKRDAKKYSCAENDYWALGIFLREMWIKWLNAEKRAGRTVAPHLVDFFEKSLLVNCLQFLPEARKKPKKLLDAMKDYLCQHLASLQFQHANDARLKEITRHHKASAVIAAIEKLQALSKARSPLPSGSSQLSWRAIINDGQKSALGKIISARGMVWQKINTIISDQKQTPIKQVAAIKRIFTADFDVFSTVDKLKLRNIFNGVSRLEKEEKMSAAIDVNIALSLINDSYFWKQQAWFKSEPEYLMRIRNAIAATMLSLPEGATLSAKGLWNIIKANISENEVKCLPNSTDFFNAKPFLRSDATHLFYNAIRNSNNLAEFLNALTNNSFLQKYEADSDPNSVFESSYVSLAHDVHLPSMTF